MSAAFCQSLLRIECEQMLNESGQRVHGSEPSLGEGLVKVLDVGQVEGPGLAHVVLHALRVHHAGRDRAARHSEVGLGVDLDSERKIILI